MLTVFRVVVLALMMLMYALGRRGPSFVLAFACGRALFALNEFISGVEHGQVSVGLACIGGFDR